MIPSNDIGCSRPRVAIVSNSLTPYRVHLHRRIISELTEIELWTILTHDISNSRWTIDDTHDIRPVCLGPGEDSSLQASGRKQWHEWRKGGRLISWLKMQNIQCIIMCGYNDLGRLRVIRHCRRVRLPLFIFGDSNIRAERISGLIAYIKRIVVSSVIDNATGVLYCGALGAAYFQKYGALPDRMFQFPYEPDYRSIVELSEESVSKIQAHFGLSPNRRYIVFSGRLAPEKRVDLLLGAFQEIIAERPQWDLIIVGDGHLRDHLQSAVSSAAKHRLIWTGFINDQSTMAALYRASDVLVLPSDCEPWGVVVTEAATCLAVVCSVAVGAAAELVSEGVNGYTFQPGDKGALQSALLKVTAEEHIDTMKRASADLLASWRRRSDPVQGLRTALRFAGVIGEKSGSRGEGS